MDRAGPVSTGAGEVCNLVELALRRRLPSTLAAANRLGGVPILRDIGAAGEPEYDWINLDAIEAYGQVPDPDALDKAALPAIAVSSTGTAGEARRDEENYLSITWVVLATVYARGGDYDETAAVVRGYTKVVRDTLLWYPSLDEQTSIRAASIDEQYGRMGSPGQARTIGGGAVLVEVDVDRAVDLLTPATPDNPTGARIEITSGELTARSSHPTL